MIACNQLSVNLAMSCPVRGKQVLFNPLIHTNLDMPSLTALVPPAAPAAPLSSSPPLCLCARLIRRDVACFKEVGDTGPGA